MRDEPRGYVDDNPDLAISNVQDMVEISPKSFSHVQVEDYDLHIENAPSLGERKDQNVKEAFDNIRFIGLEHLEPKFPGLPDLKVKKGHIFSISSNEAWNPIWDIDLTDEEYTRSLIGAINTLKRDLHKGSTEIITTLPKGEIVKIIHIPFDPNGQVDGPGVAVRGTLEHREAVLQNRV